MSDPADDIKRWTARRKAAAVMDIIKGKTTASELASGAHRKPIQPRIRGIVGRLLRCHPESGHRMVFP